MDNNKGWPELVWYALRVSPQKEFVTQTMLGRKGVETYVPVRKEWRRRNKYSKAKELRTFALAPGYVFAGFDSAIPLWFDIMAMNNILGVVGLKGEPKPVPFVSIKRDGKRVVGLDQIINRYPNGVIAPSRHQFMQTHHEFDIGDKVEVLSGPFDGHRVDVVDLRGGDAIIRTMLFGTERELTFAVENLVKAA